MAKNVSLPLQFRLGELLGTVILTFVGMLILVPLCEPLPENFGIAAAICGTLGGAWLSVYLCPHDQHRAPVLIVCVLSAWLAMALLGVFARLHQDSQFAALLFIFPPLIGGLIGFYRALSKDLRGWTCLFSVARHIAGVSLLLYCAEGMVIPQFSHTRSGCIIYFGPSACKAFAEAEEIYHRTDYNGDGVLEYAQHLSGKESLLMNGDIEIAMVDRAFAAAEGAPGVATPKAGYCFRVLTAQGKRAPGGAKSYIKNGRMTEGYALIAFPVQYNITGRDSFMISSTGTIYQSDLGPYTIQIACAMQEFNPISPLWTATE